MRRRSGVVNKLCREKAENVQRIGTFRDVNQETPQKIAKIAKEIPISLSYFRSLAAIPDPRSAAQVRGKAPRRL